jgi:L-fuculose-phosphate aldolase
MVRKEIVEFGRLLYERRMVTGTSGNISGRVDGDTMVITASGRCKGALKEYDLVRMEIADGRVSSGGNPSMETPFHLAFYRNRTEVGGVVHAHPLFCTLLACSGRSVRTDLTPEGLRYLGEVAFVPYATPGSEELARNLERAMRDHEAFIMENHGAITAGRDVAEAYYRMETLEYLAELQLRGEGLTGFKGLPLEEAHKVMGMAGRGGR